MAEKEVTMKLKVDVQCQKCMKKVKKVLSKFPEIRDQKIDEKQNIVIIKVVCFDPEKIRDKICCKSEGSIKTIEILTVKRPPPNPPKPQLDPRKPPADPPKPQPDPPKPPADPPKPPPDPPKPPPPAIGYPPQVIAVRGSNWDVLRAMLLLSLLSWEAIGMFLWLPSWEAIGVLLWLPSWEAIDVLLWLPLWEAIRLLLWLPSCEHL